MATSMVSASSEVSYEAAKASAESQAQAGATGSIKIRVVEAGSFERDGVYTVNIMVLTDEDADLTPTEIEKLLAESDEELEKPDAAGEFDDNAGLVAIATLDEDPVIGDNSVEVIPPRTLDQMSGEVSDADDGPQDFEKNVQEVPDGVPKNVDSDLVIDAGDIPEMSPDPAPEWGDNDNERNDMGDREKNPVNDEQVNPKPKMQSK